MKYIILTILGIATFCCYSCDNRKDTFISYDNNPVLQVERLTDSVPTTYIRDSIKLGQDYKVRYYLNDEENLDINIDKSIDNDRVNIDKDFINIGCSNTGVSTFIFKVKDSFGKSAQSQIQLTSFSNLKPVCVLNVKKVGVLSPYEVEIDLSGSFDQDAKWGGKVVNYQYRIGNNYNVQNTLPVIRYIFDSLGQKKIIVSVQDNDGAWSTEVVNYFMLQ